MILTPFNSAVKYLFKNEGGYVYDKDDPGGATNHGITQETLAAWRGAPVTPEDVLNLSVFEITSIYEAKYWRPLSCDKMTNPAIATAVFDSGVLFGVGLISLYTQKVIKSVALSTFTVDGHIGPKTISALNCITTKDFIPALQEVLEARVDAIIIKRPVSKKYERDWRKRIDRLLTLIA